MVVTGFFAQCNYLYEQVMHFDNGSIGNVLGHKIYDVAL